MTPIAHRSVALTSSQARRLADANPPHVALLEDRETDNALATPDAIEHIQPKIMLGKRLKVDLESPMDTFTRSALWWLLAAGAFLVGGSLTRDKNLPATIGGLGLAGFGLWQGFHKGRQVEHENETFVQKALDQEHVQVSWSIAATKRPLKQTPAE